MNIEEKDLLKKQASNIDEEGNVLYLDEERLKRKEVGALAEWILDNTRNWNE